MKENQSVDWTVPTAALGLIAGALNAYDSSAVIVGGEPVVGPVLNEGLKLAGLDLGLTTQQGNLIQLSVAASLALTAQIVSFKRQVFSASRLEIPLTTTKAWVMNDRTNRKVSEILSRLPLELQQGVPGLF